MRPLALCVLAVLPMLGADVYCGASSTGSGTGADWNNQCDFDTVTMVRGNTYYLADGSYATKALTIADSGATTIEIRKAREFDHGTSTGWSSTYGDGQATFNSFTPIDSNNWIVNGNGRDEDDWTDGAAYGIRVTGSVRSSALDAGVCADNVTLEYIELGLSDSGNSHTGGESDVIYNGGFGEICSGWTIQRNLAHNIKLFLQCAGCDGHLIQYNYVKHGFSKEAIRGQIRGADLTIRYNVFKDTCQATPGEGGSGCTAEIGIWDDSNDAGDFDDNEIYGNLIYKTTSESNSGGCITVGGFDTPETGVSASNTLVYNNTCAGLNGSATGVGIIINGGTGNICRNNLFYDNSSTPSVSCNTTSSNGQESTDPFVNYAGGDFHLDGAIAGTSLSSPYNEDIDGVTRGADGTFDRGAFEFDEGGGDTTPPSRSAGAPSGTIAYTTSTTLSLTTDESATCKWDADASTAYASMSDTFSSTGSTSHSTTASVSVGGNTFYVRCTDGTNANTDDYSITFTVSAAPTVTSAIGGGTTIPGGSTIP